MLTPKMKWTAGLILSVLALDLTTKAWALRALASGRTLEVLGGLVPLTLAFNTGAAFGLSIGSDPRWIFIPVSLVAVVFLFLLIRQASEDDLLRIVAASLVLGGALGNLYDRIRWDRGVVDFLGPIDLGFMLWPIFNVADMAITSGALLLAISFVKEEIELRRGQEAAAERVGREEGST